MVVPPQILRGIASNPNHVTADQEKSAQHTLELDAERRAKRTEITSPSTSSAPRPSKPSLRRLVNFYDPSINGPDSRGRTLDQILAWPDNILEFSHDYIQTLFPLPEGSIFNEIAPVIDEEAFLYFRQNDDLKRNLRRALERILAFYGFTISWAGHGGEPNTAITGAIDSSANFGRWLTRMDHNHLRITRIIRSLRVLGLEEEARAFYAALLAIVDDSGQVGQSTLGFWKRAVELPLHEAPDGEEIEWLKKYDSVEDSKEDPRNDA